MTIMRWRGNATNVAQVTTLTPANIQVNDIFTLTINGKSLHYTALTTSVADCTAGIAAAWAASSLPEFLEISASDIGSAVVLKSAKEGVPFQVATSTSDGGGAATESLTALTITPASGENHWDTAANWSTNSLPADGDTVYIEDSETSILYGLEQSAITLDALHIAASYRGEIGLAATNTQGTSDYPEYRNQELQIGADKMNLGAGKGLGSGRIRINTGSEATAITVHTTGIAADSDQQAFQWRGTAGGNTLAIYTGSVGIASQGGETATLAMLRMSGGHVQCSAGVQLTTIERSGEGSLVLESSANILNQSGGETLILGSGAYSTINLDGGQIDYRSSGTITDASLDGSNAVLDFSADLRPRTITDLTLLRGTILDPHQTIIWTNGVQAATGLRAP